MISAKEAFELASSHQARRDEEAYENAWNKIKQAAEIGCFSANIQVASRDIRQKLIRDAEAQGFSTRETNGLLIISWRNYA